MSRRIPLWATLVPLGVAIGVYWFFWNGWATAFGAAVSRVLPEAEVSVTGFPYRLEVELVKPIWTAGDGVKMVAGADRALVNRGPWHPELTVIRAEYPKFSAIVGPGFGASFTGKSALTSVRFEDGQLARLSTIIETAQARLGFMATAIMADALELHLRERVPASETLQSATLPPRGELMIRGQRLRFDNGDALTFTADMTANSAMRLTNFDGWAHAGTIEVSALRLADAHGEVAKVSATVVPTGRSGLRFAGTVETVCPASIVAALEGGPAVAELRLRAPVRLAFEGLAGALRLSGVPDDLALRARRANDPACPVVRGVQRQRVAE